MQTITTYLGKHDVSYETVTHRHTLTANETASEAHVPHHSVAKGVVFCDEDTYVLAVVPACRRVDAEALSTLLGQRRMALASEDELAYLFPDCELGAVPAVGGAYGLRSVIDASLLGEDDIYLEAGDHLSLVHITGKDFRRLMEHAPTGEISLH
jgi:Ala-tRNA(Pro) deacylase